MSNRLFEHTSFCCLSLDIRSVFASLLCTAQNKLNSLSFSGSVVVIAGKIL